MWEKKKEKKKHPNNSENIPVWQVGVKWYTFLHMYKILHEELSSQIAYHCEINSEAPL